MSQINAYLVFSGNCREAMTFYKDSLGGELTLVMIGESPMAQQWPAAMQQQVLHASLAQNGFTLLGSDAAGAGGVLKGNTVQLNLTCDTPEQAREYISKLGAGGSITRELHEFFDGWIGALTDKFGFDWMFYASK
ncbi:VOC family protein [uncultured Chitinophaga sp.]|uniref:VOC family protein n=1 Tax=uncultured Chitinophaga sp. TaxID=339340 RepID=UPI0025E02027|nr:VOC family protein [uncultured Chitinophaga sp.]